ncbi:MAG TPA: hypothetical protein VGD42_03285 [Lysobacter sp.]
MSADRDPQGPVAERYALARHGLPLPRSASSVPRAPWLPAAVRGRALPSSPRALPIPLLVQADTEEAFDPGTAIVRPPSFAHASDAGAVTTAASTDATLPQRDSASPRMPVHQDEATPAHMPIVQAMPAQPDAPVRSTQALRAPGDLATPPPATAVRQDAHRDDAIGDPTRMRDRPLGHESRAPDGEASNASHTTEHRSAGPSFPTAEISVVASDPRPADRIEWTATATPGDRVPAPVEAIAATPAVASQARDAPQIPVVQGGTQVHVMGLAAAPLDPAQTRANPAAGERPERVRQIGAAELSALQAPSPAPARSVRIDRVQVTVQAPVASGPRPPAPAAMPVTPPRAPAQPGFRNPWSSYFTRRD